MLRFDQIEQPRHPFRGLCRRQTPLRQPVQADEVCPSQVVLAEIFDALLTHVYRIHHHVLQRRTSRRDCDVVLGVDGSQVSELAVEAVQTTRVSESHEA